MHRLLLVLLLWPLAGLTQQIFHDGFENPSPGCAEGAAQSAELGPAPASGFSQIGCVEFRNDLAFARVGEQAYGGVPVPRSLNLLASELPQLLLVGPGGGRLPAQFDVLSRWNDVVDGDGAIRWLQIAVPVDVPANGRVVFALRRYASAPAPVDDPLAIASSELDGRWLIDTGLAVFEIDPTSPSLFARIALREQPGAELIEVFSHQPGQAGFGPQLVVGDGQGGESFRAGNGVPGSLQLVNVERRLLGRNLLVISADGVFSSGDARSLCTAQEAPYEAFEYSIELRFTRGSRDIDMQQVLRNACSNAFGAPWTDQAAQVLSYQWGWPLRADTPASGSLFYAGSNAAAVSGSGGSAADGIAVEQRRGAGTPWQRRARAWRPGPQQLLENAISFAAPVVGLRNDRVLAALTAPWLRFREPQALRIDGDRLQMQMLSEPVIVGEGKGLWFFNRLSLGLPGQAAAAATRLQAWRLAAQAAQERGLLPWVGEWNNAGAHFPPLDGNGPTRAPYLAFMDSHHQNTVSEAPCVDPENQDGAQWDCAKTYGSQLWPDIQFNEQFGYVGNADPSENSPFNNYWNPSNAELLEFLRSGEPRWVWDFALPQSWLQAHTMTLNIGDRSGPIRSGFVVNSTGSGDGHWHRGDGGSDDYNYNRGAHLAYALRPQQLYRDRFRIQGRTVINRYALPRSEQAQRQQFVDEVRLDRGPLQHFEGLANCAEFVPGAAGAACEGKLRELLSELAHDNLASAVICAEDIPGSGCFFGQQFMINSMFYGFLQRLLLNYGDVLHEDDNGSLLRRALIELPRQYRNFGMPLAAGEIVVDGTWAEGFDCDLATDGRSVVACQPVDIEGGNFFFVNRPQTLALLLMSDWLQPDPTLCRQARNALAALFPDPEQLGPLGEYANGGWWKGSSQVMQSLIFAVGLEQRCAAQ